MDDFILKNELKWIPYNKFKNVRYLSEGGFGTIYKAIWLKNDKEVILKCHKNLSENLNEFLKEWEYHKKCLDSYDSDIIGLYGFTKDPNTSKYMVVMDCANKGNLRENLTSIVKKNWNDKLYMLYDIISGLSKIHGKNLIHCDFHDDLMKKCWNEDPLKRPSTSEIKDVIKNWIIRPSDDKINEELKNNIKEFIHAPNLHNDLATESHPKAYYTSRMLDFTSKKLNEILESENLDNYIIENLKSLDIKADENTSENLNEILKSKDLQASVKVNEMLVSEDLNNYIIEDLKSLGMQYNTYKI
ncbi:kinase-like protein [Rhizophagus irregularis]|uniref:Kinase-like protein n=1 Tax=Rhizophagus irregularis TaxID=588596 RepID=A0A2I1HJN6_9GLOM|nr:kinase-like protein [Rhizophagus irregularis]